jgi:hypothetical protein
MESVAIRSPMRRDLNPRPWAPDRGWRVLDATMLPARSKKRRVPVVDISHLRAERRQPNPRMGPVLRSRRSARFRRR